MGKCSCCGKLDILVSGGVGACAECIRVGEEKAVGEAEDRHRSGRLKFGLPERSPEDKGGISCDLCVRTCIIGADRRGYCGVRTNRSGQLHGGDEEGAAVDWYLDPLPTNCVADWVCPAGSKAGYPRYSYSEGPEHGYKNLAVFYRACSFDCLFCQNWHYRSRGNVNGNGLPPRRLVQAIDSDTSCICHFGGDPGPQIRHAISASNMAMADNRDRILRICWETNASVGHGIFDEMVNISLISGGIVKVDLKAFDPRIHKALCGVDNRRTFANFERAARRIKERTDPPLLVASTLMVPGYVDAKEVGAIAQFIADLDPDIPYALLGFRPDFMMNDLPGTSAEHAKQAREAALAAGLKNVRIGNTHILGPDYDKMRPAD